MGGSISLCYVMGLLYEVLQDTTEQAPELNNVPHHYHSEVWLYRSVHQLLYCTVHWSLNCISCTQHPLNIPWFLPFSLYCRHSSSLLPFPIRYTLANVALVTCVIITCAPLLCSLFWLLLLGYVELCLECLIYLLLSALMHILYSIYYEIMNALLRLVVGEACICVWCFIMKLATVYICTYVLYLR